MRVYYDLTKSVYVTDYKELEFYFSSQYYLTKFLNAFDEYQQKELNKIASRLKVNIEYLYLYEIDKIIALSLYSKIEKRGHHVVIK